MPLEPCAEGGNFAGYISCDTDLFWVGFAIGMRSADRILRADGSAGIPIHRVVTPSAGASIEDGSRV